MIGLEELQFNNDPDSAWKWVVYKSDELQLMFFQTDDKPEDFPKIPVGFGNLPGDGVGDHLESSISVTGHNHESFKSTVEKIQKSSFETQSENPTWRQDSYWGFTVKDPMGKTVEICWEPKDNELDIEVNWSK